MNNKNEKTFSDLFKNFNDDDSNFDEVNQNEVTFNNFSDGNNDSVSFNNIFEENDIVLNASSLSSDDSINSSNNFSFNDISKEEIIEEKVGAGVTVDSDVDNTESALGVSFNSILMENEDTVSANDNINNLEEKIVNDIPNISQDTSVSNGDLSFSAVIDVSKNDVVDVVDSVNDGITSELVNESVFFDNEVDNKDSNVDSFNSETLNNKEEVVSENIKDSNNNKEAEVFDSNVEKLDGSIFGFDKDDKESDLDISLNNNVVSDNVVDENIFGLSGDSDSNLSVEKDNNNVLDSDLDITSEDLNNKDAINDVANDSDSNFIIENPLFSEKISLDEGYKVNNSIDKIDLSKTKHFQVKVEKKKEPLLKFVVGVISYAFFIWLLLIGITLLVYVLDIKIRASKGDYSSPLFNAYVVLTGSMLPEIQVNDVVITKKVEAKYLEVGDIITFASTDSRFSGTIITHRIIKKNPDVDGNGITFQTKGDNNNVADSALVSEGNIYGKVILKIPKLGYLQEFLATDGGWIIVILIPCLTVISYDIVKILKGLKRKKYNNINVKK